MCVLCVCVLCAFASLNLCSMHVCLRECVIMYMCVGESAPVSLCACVMLFFIRLRACATVTNLTCVCLCMSLCVYICVCVLCVCVSLCVCMCCMYVCVSTGMRVCLCMSICMWLCVCVNSHYHVGLAYANSDNHPMAILAYNQAVVEGRALPKNVLGKFRHERAKSLQMVGRFEEVRFSGGVAE